MGLGGALLLAVGLVVAFMNAVTTRRLWASTIFETSQKVAQTIIMWPSRQRDYRLECPARVPDRQPE